MYTLTYRREVRCIGQNGALLEGRECINHKLAGEDASWLLDLVELDPLREQVDACKSDIITNPLHLAAAAA